MRAVCVEQCLFAVDTPLEVRVVADSMISEMLAKVCTILLVHLLIILWIDNGTSESWKEHRGSETSVAALDLVR